QRLHRDRGCASVGRGSHGGNLGATTVKDRDLVILRKRSSSRSNQRNRGCANGYVGCDARLVGDERGEIVARWGTGVGVGVGVEVHCLLGTSWRMPCRFWVFMGCLEHEER